MTKSNAVLGTIIIILILCMGFIRGCDREASNVNHSTITVVDSTYTTDTVRRTIEMLDTVYREVSFEVAVPDSMLVPIHIDVQTGKDYNGFSMFYNDMVSVDSTDVYYFIEWTEKGIESLSFEVKTMCPEITKTVLDTILVTNTINIERTKETVAPKRVRLMGGGALGYNFVDKLPIVSPLIGIKDKKDRLYYVTCDILTQGVAIGVAIPLTR